MATQSSVAKKIVKGLFYLGLLSLPLVFWLNRFLIFDWWRLRDYSPPARIQALATDTTMNDSTKRVFYAQHPQIDDKQQLSANCQQNEYTIVLGCYVASRGIYLYSVSDPRLNGVEEVTAAHELLHAAYDRLSSSERKRIDELTAQAYAQVTNARIKATIEQYRKNDASVVPNELHSILGTEVRSLPPELEAHYKKYFSDRSAVVKFSEQYESEFTSRQKQVEEYDKQLSALKSEIETNEAKLEQQAATLSNERSNLENSRSDAQVYNSQVDSFNAKVASYNNLVSQSKVLIDKYNALVVKRNALAVEVNDLAKAIDTRPTNLQSQ